MLRLQRGGDRVRACARVVCVACSVVVLACRLAWGPKLCSMAYMVPQFGHAERETCTRSAAGETGAWVMAKRRVDRQRTCHVLSLACRHVSSRLVSRLVSILLLFSFCSLFIPLGVPNCHSVLHVRREPALQADVLCVCAALQGTVVDVALGEFHGAAVTRDGSLFTWGKDKPELLGHDKSNGCVASEFVYCVMGWGPQS